MVRCKAVSIPWMRPRAKSMREYRVLCGSVLPQPDPTITTLRNSLDRLQLQLDGIDAMRPLRPGIEG